MPTETKTDDEVAELVKALPPHLREQFEKAEADIREFYGVSPGVPALMRLWISCGTHGRVRREFESAVLGIGNERGGLPTNEIFDEDDL